MFVCCLEYGTGKGLEDIVLLLVILLVSNILIVLEVKRGA